jgi:pimeloyl-ACP methyl ester carboxylesterase
MHDLVMIPALGCDERLYGKIAPALVDIVSLRTIVADHNTFDDCIRQILTEAPETFVVLGTSFGGRAAMEVTLASPKRVNGLIVIGSTPGPAPDPAAGLRRSARLRSNEQEQVVAEMADMVSHLPGPNGPATRDAFITMARTQGAELMARQSDALANRSDLRPRLSSIKCPALMLWGIHDHFAPASDGLALSKAIPGARYVEIPDCGHFPPLEAPEETAGAIRHWLASNGLT